MNRMVKYDNRVVSNLKDGKRSVAVDNILKRIDMAPFTDVEKIEFQNFVNQQIAKTIAFDVDSFSRKMISDSLKETGLQVTTYQSDLFNTQSKLADLESENSFHNSVIRDLKNQYYKETDPDNKLNLLEEIRKEENALKVSLKLYNELINTRNKIRNALSKRIDKDTKKKEMEEGTVIDIEDLDMEE